MRAGDEARATQGILDFLLQHEDVVIGVVWQRASVLAACGADRSWLVR